MTAYAPIRLSLVLIGLLAAAACRDEAPAPQPAPPANASQTPEAAKVAAKPDASSPAASQPAATESSEPALPKFKSRVEEPANAAPGDLVLVREYHENGVLATERTELIAADGKRVRQGPMKAWHANGELYIEGGYDEQGRLGGHWRYYDEQGEIQREGGYESGLRSGDWTEYWPGGQMKSQGFLHVGLCEGPWKYWYENGQLRAEGSYENNRREGHWSYFLADGKPDPVESGEYRNNVRVK